MTSADTRGRVRPDRREGDDVASESDAAALRMSLLVLGTVVAIALVGLGFAGNWPKVLRVALAAGSYTGVLIVLAHWRRALPLGAFMAAGAAAGSVSGLVRESTSAALIAAGALGAALLLGPLHWWALRTWQLRTGNH